jgi:hypothetical protein
MIALGPIGRRFVDVGGDLISRVPSAFQLEAFVVIPEARYSQVEVDAWLP